MRGAVTALLQLHRPCAIHDTQQQQMQGAHNVCAQRTVPLTRVCVAGLLVRVLNRAQTGAKSRVRPCPQAAAQRHGWHIMEVLRLEEEQGRGAKGWLCEPGWAHSAVGPAKPVQLCNVPQYSPELAPQPRLRVPPLLCTFDSKLIIRKPPIIGDAPHACTAPPAPSTA